MTRLIKSIRSISPSVDLIEQNPPTDGEKRGKTVIRINIKLNAHIKGPLYYRTDVILQKGNPVTALKDSICALEKQMGLQLESFEAIDIARLFFSVAQEAGFSIKGFPPLAEDKEA